MKENKDSQQKHSLRHQRLERLGRIAVDHYGLVFLSAALLTAVAAAFIPNVNIVTDRGALVDSDDPEQVRYREVSEMFGSVSLAIVVLEGDDRERLRSAANELATRLEEDEQVRSVFYRLDMGFFHEKALLYLTDDQFECLEFAFGPSGLGSAMPDEGEPGLIGLVNGVKAQIETASPDTQIPTQCGDVHPLTLMTRLFGEIGSWVEDPSRETLEIITQGDLPAGGPSPGQYGVDEEGYLVESDSGSGYSPDDQIRPHLLFLLVQPMSTSGDETIARELVTTIRGHAADVAESYGIREGVTGMPAIITDEMDAVRSDVKNTIVTAIIFVLLLFFATFRSLRATAIVALPLVLGLVWAAGFAAIVYTNLTMVSVYFAAVLFGLGIAFGIHLLSRFDEARRDELEPSEAVLYAMRGAGPGIVTGGVTTAAAFLAVGLCDFRGFAQLGVVAGSGVLLMLLASLTVMPAALFLWRGKPLPEPKTRAWLGTLGGWISKRATAIILVTTVLSATGIYGALQLEFDYDFIKLLPSEAEALKYYALMEERSEFSSDVAISITDSLEEAEERRQRLESLETVARAEAVSKYLPGSREDQGKRVRRIIKIAEKATVPLAKMHKGALRALSDEHRVNPEVMASALEELGDSVEDAWFAAQQTGRSETPALKVLSKTVRASAKIIRDHEQTKVAGRLLALDQHMAEGVSRGTKVLLGNFTNPGALGAEDLPPSVRERFITKGPDGTDLYAVYAYPTGRAGNREFLERFYPDITSVDPEITGFPVTHYFHGELARQAFFQAALYAALATLLLLALDFRRLRDVILAAIPLAVGASLMLGTMELLGYTYNFVNVVALPLVFGAGVDFGVHLVHRLRQEGDATAALKSTGRPVILSAVTTLVGMGGLALAEHRGAASLGSVLVMGIGFCLLSAAFVLPAAMELWGRLKKG